MLVSVAFALLQSGLTADIDVPFRVSEDAIIVDATVNGKAVSLMFDTGFGGAVIIDNTINVGKPTGTMGLRDFVGTFEAPTVKVTSLRLGPKSIDPTGMEVVLQRPQNYSEAYNTHVDGLMGFEVIKNEVTEINFEKKCFIFHPSSTDISRRIPDNKRTFLSKLLPVGASSMQMEVRTPNGKTMIMSLDTGNAFFAATHRDVLERVGQWPKDQKAKYMRISGVASGPVESFYKRMDNMRVFGIAVPYSVWSVIELPSSDAESDGTIGFEFLKNFNITIDYGRRRVWFENFSGVTGNQSLAGVGISAGSDTKLNRAVIYRVSPDSPAERAGIKEGDQVLSVDGVDVSTFPFRRMERMLEGTKDTTVKLALSRSGQLKRYELKREPLVND